MAVMLVALAANAQEQVKSVSAATNALNSAKEATNNPKKNTKPATWIKYGQTLIDAYSAPAGNGIIGMNAQEVALLNGGEKATAEDQVEINGTPYIKQTYATKNYYFNANGQLAIVEVTKPITETALLDAVDAFSKAASLDNGSKTKDIVSALESINGKFNMEAVTAYNLGDLKRASVEFENAAKALATAPCSKVDTSAIYNAGLTAIMGGDRARAKKFFQECLGYNYYGSDGDVFAKLADIAKEEGDAAASKSILEEGFTKYPQSQSILVGLINYYMSSGEDTNRLFVLLDDAKKNEPNNASLYYVEGDIRAKLGQEEEAVKAYLKCSEINPEYEFGYIGLGVYYYNKAIQIQEAAANELDDTKYNILVSDFEKSLKSCIEPFEKAYDLTKNEEVKVSVAEYLKNACFRFRTEDPAYMAKYEKYSNVK